MSKSRLSTSIACLLAVAGLAACGSSSNSSSDSSKKSGPITIGFVIGKTGVLESYDIPAATAAKYAIADINKAGGVDGRQIKTVEADMKSKPELAGTAATDVISKGADILITPCDFDLGSPAAIQAKKAG
jgi:branched-chain amino acid transport system substrate-binding protein